MSTSQLPPVEIKPAPWRTKSECYWLMLYMPAELPESIYDPLEASSAEFADPEVAGKFRGGLGIIMIVRYSDTPCGPYDELMIIPGVYDVPGQRTKRKRIARIYVNQRETTYNGRLAWNIPKHLARFSFSSPPTTASQSPPQSLHVAVYPPDPAAQNPFFSATLTPMRWIPAMPFSTRWLPVSMSITQPPLPTASAQSRSGPEAELDRDPVEEQSIVVGTSRWCTLPITGSAPRARGMWIELHTPRVGSDEEKEAQHWWPQHGVKPFQVGAWLEDCTLDIGKPSEWKL